MICHKCKRKYEDDMPRCLWCDAPNLNYGKFETEMQACENTEPGTLEEVPSSKGTLIFCQTFLAGECGLHLFLTGNYLKGFAYLFFGSFTYSFVVD